MKYTETKRFKKLAEDYLKDIDPYGPEWEKEMMKWTKRMLIDCIKTISQNGKEIRKPRKKHVMGKRQNKDAKRSTETPIDKRGTFWN